MILPHSHYEQTIPPTQAIAAHHSTPQAQIPTVLQGLAVGAGDVGPVGARALAHGHLADSWELAGPMRHPVLVLVGDAPQVALLCQVPDR